MAETGATEKYRFGVFEVDASTGELRRQGIRVKLNAQPFQVLLMLLERPGSLLTREEIAGRLWPDGTFVDFEHGVNSALNRIREALGDAASNPRFVETLARRGYRFIAPVERIGAPQAAATVVPPPAVPEPPGLESSQSELSDSAPSVAAELEPENIPEETDSAWLATPKDLPKTPPALVKALFLLLQVMYAGFYVGALANLPEISDLMSPLPRPEVLLLVLIVTAGLLIPVRAFLFCAVLFRPPELQSKLLKVWKFVLPFDVLWSLSPFLLLHHINFGVALSCTALLLYAPFAQRSLMLMMRERAENKE